MAVGSRQVKRRVVPHVGGVDPGTPGDQHLHYLDVATLGCPVEGGELVVIAANDQQ